MEISKAVTYVKELINGLPGDWEIIIEIFRDYNTSPEFADTLAKKTNKTPRELKEFLWANIEKSQPSIEEMLKSSTRRR